jgi:SAM-dependent methyltransferase
MRQALEVLFLTPREWGTLPAVPGLWRVEALMGLHYLVRFPPLDIWLQARLLDRPFEDFRYGDTPWFTGLAILRRAGVGPADTLYDLGCGRGKMVFLAHLACGCRAVGVELLASYVLLARRIARQAGLGQGPEFVHGDFLRCCLSPATVLYAAAATWSESTRAALLQRLEEVRPGARWITVAWDCRHPLLEPEGEEEHLFSWGRAPVRYYRRKEEATSSMRPSGCTR